MNNLNRIYISFPGGGGGYWLKHLVYLLQADLMPDENTAVNFHNHVSSKNIVINHGPNDTVNDWKVFSSKYSFNLYLQALLKRQILEYQQHQESFVEKFNNLLQVASNNFSNEWHNLYLKNIDLHYDLMFENPENFIDELFALLDSKKIVYFKNRNIVLQAIVSFKKTLPDPMDHFDNLDSILWLGWCFGILHHEKLPGNIDYNNCTKEEIVESILPRREYFVNYTKPYFQLIK
jgi:hypothetical protein